MAINQFNSLKTDLKESLDFLDQQLTESCNSEHKTITIADYINAKNDVIAQYNDNCMQILRENAGKN